MDISERTKKLKTCDRCGRIFYNIDQIARKKINGSLVLYSCDTDKGEQHIDLCQDCYNKLSEWYRNYLYF